MPSPPVWYLENRVRINENGQDVETINCTGSAVLVTVRRKAGGHAEQRLLTARHVLRRLRAGTEHQDKITGHYTDLLRVWPVDVGLNEQTSIAVTIDDALTAPETDSTSHPDDLAFLKLPNERRGATPASLLPEVQNAAIDINYSIFGYVSGENLIDVQQGRVLPLPYTGWTFTVPDATAGFGLLAPGMGRPAGGVSGGGVFSGDRLAGIYRGEVVGVGPHVFMPIRRISEWLAGRDGGWELVDITMAGDISTIASGIVTAGSMKGNPAAAAKIESGKSANQTLITVLEQFLISKTLHDHLHRMQTPVLNALKASRKEPFDGLRLSSFNTARKTMAEESTETGINIGRISDKHATIKAGAEAWQRQIQKAVADARTAALAKKQLDAAKACRAVAQIVKMKLTSLNDDLVAFARAMKLEALAEFLRDLARMPTTQPATGSALEESANACDRVLEGLVEHTRIHDEWQLIDDLIWIAAQSIGSKDMETFDLQWTDISDHLLPLLDSDPDADWSVDIRLAHASINAAKMSADPWNELSVLFEAFAEDSRSRFFSVDSNLKVQAEKVSTLGERLTLLS